MSPADQGADEDPAVGVVLRRRGDGVWELILERSRSRNAIDDHMAGALAEAAGRLASEEVVRVVLVRGAGPSFCAGADLDVLADLDQSSARAFIGRLHDAFARIRRLPAVTVAVVQGHCVGAGLELALSCDLRICDASARLAMPEVKVGIPSVIEAALLPRLVGWGAATDLLLTGRTIDAREARGMGLVQRVAGEGGLEETVEELLVELDDVSPRAVALQKELLRRWEELPLDAAIRAGIHSLGEAYRPVDGEIEPRRRIRRLRSRRGGVAEEEEPVSDRGSRSRNRGGPPAG